jgi:uncharacterized protein YjbJ (UPF0337 family)
MSENQMEGTARNVGGKIESAVGNLTGDTKNQAQGKVDQIAGQAQKAYGNAKDAVSDAADKVSEHASGLGGQMYEAGEYAAETVADYVRNEPVAVMLGVAAVGMLIGYLIGRPPAERAVELGRFRAAYRDR